MTRVVTRARGRRHCARRMITTVIHRFDHLPPLTGVRRCSPAYSLSRFHARVVAARAVTAAAAAAVAAAATNDAHSDVRGDAHVLDVTARGALEVTPRVVVPISSPCARGGGARERASTLLATMVAAAAAAAPADQRAVHRPRRWRFESQQPTLARSRRRAATRRGRARARARSGRSSCLASSPRLASPRLNSTRLASPRLNSTRVGGRRLSVVDRRSSIVVLSDAPPPPPSGTGACQLRPPAEAPPRRPLVFSFCPHSRPLSQRARG